jgi:hypothetical protein
MGTGMKLDQNHSERAGLAATGSRVYDSFGPIALR